MFVGRQSRALLILALLFASVVFAQEPEAKKPDADKKQQIARRVIDWTIDNLNLHFDDETVKPMQSQVVLRWPNPVRAFPDGATVLWTEKGRPQAVCCLWTGNDFKFCYGAFGLLSTGPVVAKLDGRSIWHPKRPGPSVTEFAPIPDAPPPSKNAKTRLRQMKLLARRFASDLADPGSRAKLRLLPRPIYRYEINAEREQKPAVLDGALFAFVLATDPESLLMIEARRTADAYQWQYAAATRADAKIEVFLDDKLVHTLSIRCIPYNPESDFTCWSHPVPDEPDDGKEEQSR